MWARLSHASFEFNEAAQIGFRNVTARRTFEKKFNVFWCESERCLAFFEFFDPRLKSYRLFPHCRTENLPDNWRFSVKMIKNKKITYRFSSHLYVNSALCLLDVLILFFTLLVQGDFQHRPHFLPRLEQHPLQRHELHTVSLL